MLTWALIGLLTFPGNAGADQLPASDAFVWQTLSELPVASTNDVASRPPTMSVADVSSCPDLDHSTLLSGTLQSVYSFIDPLTGLLHDSRRFLDHGNADNPFAGIVPDLDPQLAQDRYQFQDLKVEFISGEPLTLDHGLKLTYVATAGSKFGYLAIPAMLNLDAPRISGLKIRGRASRPNAPLEVKVECADGRHQIWNTTFDTGTFGWRDLALPTPAPCDLTRVDKLTFAASDAKLPGFLGEVVWEIDHAAFTVDPTEIGKAHTPPLTCEGPYQPLPCRGIATNVDNVGYGLAALAVAACLRRPVNVPGFDSPEQAILRALDTLESWPKWNGESPGTAFQGRTGFPWTWFSPVSGLPPRDLLNVFALDQAHLASGLQVLEQAAGSPACELDPASREMIRVKARALRLGMDWGLLVRDGDLALEWRVRPDGSGCSGLCGTERARGNESILRTFQSVATKAVAAGHFAKLSCEVTVGAGGHAWYKTFNEQPCEDPTRCSATFVQQAPLIFLDGSRLPKSRTLKIHDHVESVTELMRAHGLDLPQLRGWSDCQLPDGSDYKTGCAIPASVVTPQAAILGLEFLPQAAQSLCEFHKAGVDRPYALGGAELNRGMRDSYSLETQSVGNAVFLGLDQARNALALFNLLYPNFGNTGLSVVRALFAADAGASEAYDTLRKMSVCNDAPALTIATNAASYRTADSMTIAAEVNNPGLATTVDFYIGALLPDGDTVIVFTESGSTPRVGRLASPATLLPTLAGVDLTSPSVFSKPALFTHRWSGNEPPGTYVLFLAAVRPGALLDNVVNPGDIVLLATSVVCFSP